MVDMRVIRPEEFKRLPKKKKHKKLPIVIMLIVVAIVAFALTRPDKPKDSQQAQDLPAEQQQSNVAPAPKTGKLKTFTGEEFKKLAQSIKYPNTQLFAEAPPISGNAAADARIRAVAEARGYRLTSIPMGSIVKINEPRLEGDDLLQPLAALDWQALKDAAKRDRIPLSITSGYRSPEYQRDLFMKRLLARNVTVAQIAAGGGDAAVESTLGITAVPGYSRHHTGYTIDLWCEDRTGSFVVSSCYKWISANNYQIAKETGWIPSYPDGVEGQGPEPEPWEYVWVGKDYLTE